MPAVHVAKSCTAATCVCKHRGKTGHDFLACREKSAQPRCPNCKEGGAQGRAHRANSMVCPAYTRALWNLVSRTAYVTEGAVTSAVLESENKIRHTNQKSASLLKTHNLNHNIDLKIAYMQEEKVQTDLKFIRNGYNNKVMVEENQPFQASEFLVDRN